jgi:hypothetical protein
MVVPKHRQGQKQSAKPDTLPAPLRGINATASLANMSPEECIYSYNIMPRDYGQETRAGYREFANGWTGDADANTVIPFEGSLQTGVNDRLWVANRQGVWNCTTLGETAPVQVITWADSGTGAGQCSFVTFVNDGGSYFLLLCDERNGYWVYKEDTDAWVEITQGAGADQVDGEGGEAGASEFNPRGFVFVMTFKERIWFIRRDSGDAIYLDFGVFAGTGTRFIFGRNFRSGGDLQWMGNWTLDGGNGIDDYMVALSGAGDVVIYQGSDPDSASDWGLKGVWNIGETPNNRRQGIDFGGEVYLLSVFGLLPLSQVLNGASISDPTIYLTYKISPYLRRRTNESIQDPGWQVMVAPQGGSLYVNTPEILGEAQENFAFYFGTQGWGIIRDVPMLHIANWRGDQYFTKPGINKLWVSTGSDTADAVHLDPDADGVSQVIEFSMLTSFNPLGTPAVYKRCQYIRPIWIGKGIPVFNVQARYDFDVSEVLTTPALQGVSQSGLWDASTSTWDLAIWGGAIHQSDNPRGANGLGRHVAVAIRGRTADFSTLVAFDVISDSGGMM